MDNLQYLNDTARKRIAKISFKPYYKWITFNTLVQGHFGAVGYILVLNLIING